MTGRPPVYVIAGLVPAIHVGAQLTRRNVMIARADETLPAVWPD